VTAADQVAAVTAADQVAAVTAADQVAAVTAADQVAAVTAADQQDQVFRYQPTLLNYHLAQLQVAALQLAHHATTIPPTMLII
jgi:hypothetical protein